MASMSDEESFVILGSTPTPSMNGFIDRMDDVVVNSNTATTAEVIPAGTNSPADSSLVRFQLGPMNGSSLQLQPSANHQLRQNHINSVLSDPFSMLSMNGKVDRRSVGVDVGDGNGSNKPTESANGLADAMLESGSFKSVVGSVRSSNDVGLQLNLLDNAEQMQASILDYFPSLGSSLASSPEEIEKLGSLVCEHIQLKENLEKTNIAMRQHFTMIRQWQHNMQKYKLAKERETAERETEVKKLRNELLALNKELVDQSERYELSRKLMQQENVELVQHVSHQKSMLINMANQISQLEKDAHSFECLSMRSTNAVQDEASIGAVSVASVQSLQQSVKSLNEQLSHVQSANREHEAAKTERETALQSLQSLHSQSQSTIDDLNEQLAAKQADMEKLKNIILDHSMCARDQKSTIESLNEQLKNVATENRQLEDMKHVVIQQANRVEELQNVISSNGAQLSSVLAENLEIQEMKQIFVDQINCLEVNLASAEELLKKSNAICMVEKSNNAELSKQLAAKDERISDMESRVGVLNAQLEMYREDFETERKSRQDIASEREELLSDLKLLQRRNEELMKQKNVIVSQTPAARPSSTSSTTSAQAPAAKQRTTSSPSTSSATLPAPVEPSVRSAYTCPLCDKKYVHLGLLESHVNDCLSKMA